MRWNEGITQPPAVFISLVTLKYDHAADFPGLCLARQVLKAAQGNRCAEWHRRFQRHNRYCFGLSIFARGQSKPCGSDDWLA